MNLKQITDDIWLGNSPMRLMGVDLRRSYAVIRHDDSLTLLSPTDVMDVDAISSLGQVKHIVAPTRFHDTGMRTASAHFPEAELWGVSGLSSLLPGLPLQELNTECIPEGWSGHVQCILIEGMPKVSEHVLWHSKSATLITSDLIFNIRSLADPWTKIFYKLNGAWERPGPTRIFRSFIKDKSAFARSIQRVRELPIQRILPAHGQVIDQPAHVSDVLLRLLS